MSVFSEIKGVYDLLKTIQRDVKNAALQQVVSEILAKLNDVLFQVGDLSRSALELERENERLRQENDHMKKWGHEKDQYVLKQLAPGAFVYAAKDAQGDGGANQKTGEYLCPHCYEKREKAVLQFAKKDFSGTHYRCHSCGLVVIDHDDRAEAVAMVAPVSRGRRDGLW